MLDLPRKRLSKVLAGGFAHRAVSGGGLAHFRVNFRSTDTNRTRPGNKASTVVSVVSVPATYLVVLVEETI